MCLYVCVHTTMQCYLGFFLQDNYIFCSRRKCNFEEEEDSSKMFKGNALYMNFVWDERARWDIIVCLLCFIRLIKSFFLSDLKTSLPGSSRLTNILTYAWSFIKNHMSKKWSRKGGKIIIWEEGKRHCEKWMESFFDGIILTKSNNVIKNFPPSCSTTFFLSHGRPNLLDF